MLDSIREGILLDTETISLKKGSGIHQIAMFDVKANTLQDIYPKPNYVITSNDTLQDITGLASSERDIYRGMYPNDWREVIKSSLIADKKIDKTATESEVMASLKKNSAFLETRLDTEYPYLLGKPMTNYDERVDKVIKANPGIAVTRQEMDIRDFLRTGGAFEQATRGKTLWIANVPFEGKQLGAAIGAMEAEGEDVTVKSNFETRGKSPEFYVTGKEVNEARVKAQISGDWTQVWTAYKKPTQGTAVRDIQDVLRAFKSYGYQLGLSKNSDVYSGTSLDIAYRLFASFDDPSKLLEAESHHAMEDTAISAKTVLFKAAHLTEALEQVKSGSDLGKTYIEQAKSKQGPLWEAASYFHKEEQIQSAIDERNIIKRLARAETDLIEKGSTYQTEGYDSLRRITQETDSGQVDIPVLQHKRVEYTQLDQVIDHIKRSKKYDNTQLDNLVTDFRTTLGETTGQERLGLIEARVAKTDTLINDTIGANLPKLISSPKNASTLLNASTAKSVQSMIPDRNKLLMGAGIAVGVLGNLGNIASMFKDNNEQPSVLTRNYDQWFEKQAEFYSMDSGDRENGIAASQRKQMTDFGSPYRGPIGSNYVLQDQELLDERKKWLRSQYGARHFQESSFSPFEKVRSAMPKGYSYLTGEKVTDMPSLLRGNLLELDPSNYKIKVEDADTITLQRGGIMGAVASFFGMNKGYSFRLAGIDAPETSHGEGSYHAPQPHAYQSTNALKNMISSASNLRLIYDPSQTTYGRAMGVLYADNKNVNMELVRTGMATHLAFGKPEDSMIDYRALASVEATAAQSQRGLWAHPYFKIYRQAELAARNDITLNTFTKKDRIISNIGYMNTLALMEQAEAQGFASNADLTEAANIGYFTRMGADKVRPYIFQNNQSHIGQFMSNLQTDLGEMMRSKGGDQQNKFSQRGDFGKLNQSLTLDTMGTGTSVWRKPRSRFTDVYEVDEMRKYRQAEAQQQALNNLSNSSQNHYRM